MNSNTELKKVIKLVQQFNQQIALINNPEYQKIQAKKEAEKAEKITRQIALENDEVEFRIEVIDAIEKAGFSRHVAVQMTQTEKSLLDNAKKYNVI